MEPHGWLAVRQFLHRHRLKSRCRYNLTVTISGSLKPIPETGSTNIRLQKIIPLIVPVTPGLTPTTDLVVSDILIPENTVAGEPFTVQWEIQNTGANTARGRIRDGVYLVDSRDDDRTLGNAILLGVAERDIDLAPGERMRMQQRVECLADCSKPFRWNPHQPDARCRSGFLSGWHPHKHPNHDSRNRPVEQHLIQQRIAWKSVCLH